MGCSLVMVGKGQDAQTSLPDFTLKGLSCFYCHRDRLLPEIIGHLCFTFFFFECSIISSVFPNQIDSWRPFPSSLVYPSSCTHCDKQEKQFIVRWAPHLQEGYPLLAIPEISQLGLCTIPHAASCYFLGSLCLVLAAFGSPLKNFGVYRLYVPWLPWKYNLCNLINSFVRFTEEVFILEFWFNFKIGWSH